VNPEAWSVKEVTQLLVQCGALGLCFLMMAMGVYLVLQLGGRCLEKMESLNQSLLKLTCLIVDHKARAGDTPPEREW
jgi:hypothetical protein